MRQGIVMEKHRRYTIVMTEDGTFQKAKPIPDSIPGDEVEFEPYVEKQWSFAVFPKQLKPGYRMIAMVAAFLIAILPLYSWFDSNRAYAYVNIDMNPSIEMKVNDKMKVKELVPLNDDASLLVEKITDWKNESVEKVTVTVIQKGEETGLINDKKGVMIGVSYEKHMQDNKEITKVIDEYLQMNPINYNVATFEVPEDIRKQAHKEKKSMNELFAKQYQEKASKTSTTESSNRDINDEEKEAIETFYQENQDDESAPDSSQDQESNEESENGQTPLEKEKKDPEENQNKNGKSSENPVGKEKGWEKNKDKGNKDRETDNHKQNDLPPGLEKKKDDLEEILKSLPPAFQKKIEQEGVEDIEDLLEILPPGIQKKLERSDLQEIRKNLRRLESDLFSDFHDHADQDQSEGTRNPGKNSKENPPGQAKKDKHKPNSKQDEKSKDKNDFWDRNFNKDRDSHEERRRGMPDWLDNEEEDDDDRDEKRSDRGHRKDDDHDEGKRGWNNRDGEERENGKHRGPNWKDWGENDRGD